MISMFGSLAASPLPRAMMFDGGEGPRSTMRGELEGLSRLPKSPDSPVSFVNS